jgi:hypothetical protein
MSDILETNDEIKECGEIKGVEESKKVEEVGNNSVQNKVDLNELVKGEKSPSIVGIIERMTEYALRKIIFWENDDKRVGIIIRFFHNAFFYMMILIYIINHTVFPSYILFVVFYCACFIIWLQHIFCGDCIIHHIENRLLGDKKGVLSPFMELFNIHSDEYNSKILVMASTLVTGMLTFELITRTIFICKSWLF